MIVQRLKKLIPQDVSIAERYFAIVSAFNQLGLTDREIQLMGYIVTSGSITVPSHRTTFCTVYKTTSATVNNMVSKLKKKNLLVKMDGKIVVNPIISLDFSKDVQLDIKLVHG